VPVPILERPLPARRTPDRVTARAPAKVNLHLSVGRLRADGFHDLTTVFQAVGLYDDVPLERADALTVEVTGESADQVPVDETNLAVRAVRLLARHTGRPPTWRSGSPRASRSPAAAPGAPPTPLPRWSAATRCGDRLPRTCWPSSGASSGSDVPFSLHGGTALGTGRGEQLTPVLGQGSYAWVLALSVRRPVHARGLRPAGPPARGRPGGRRVLARPTCCRAALGDAVALGRALGNDLQGAALALRPELRQVLDTGRSLGALGALVSGSGPTVALLARDAGHAVDLAAALATSGVCDAVRRADGPVPGARVVEVV
jgi:4-diphosphocytidyl-2-C-methyl-D-erythritol kinase